MDLLKAFETIDYELLTAKLHEYWFSIEPLEILLSYLLHWWQSVKTNKTFNSWTQLIQGVPQWSAFCPILLSYFFALKEIDICNCEWYSSLCLRFKSEHSVRKIEHNSELANAWFEISYMKMNTDKCYLLSSGCKHEHMRAKIGHDMIWESNIVKQRRVTIYNHFNIWQLRNK